MLIADKRYCLDKAGQVVDCESDAAASLLVGEGGSMTEADAKKYGLKLSGPPEPLSAVDQARADMEAAMARGGEEEARMHRDRLAAAVADAEGTTIEGSKADAKAQDAPPSNKAKKAAPENKGA